jgi:hypothetical protein
VSEQVTSSPRGIDGGLMGNTFPLGCSYLAKHSG